MTVINPNSISGITSITLPAGADNVLTIHTNDGVERFRIDSTGNIKVGTAATISPDGDLFVTGVCTATTLSGSGANLTNLPAANVTGTLPAISGANLTNLTAGNLTGALPAISGANLTGIAATDNVRTGILDVAGIATFRSDVNLPNINGGKIGGRRNLIINGAMIVAQRGTSSTSTNYATVDRYQCMSGGTDEAPTQAQVDVASGTTPYTLGFRKAYKITNGNQTSGAGASDYIYIRQKIEAQNVATSGWNYTSSSSFITLSFWVKSSVAQNFHGHLKTVDGTGQNYIFETGSLSADTWTKVTKTVPGNSNITIDNNNAQGLELHIAPFYGTNYTDSSSLNTWAAYSSTSKVADMTSTWYTTNDATFELTGVQLEVGSQATAFEHRPYSEELALCQRYFHSVINQGWATAGYNGSYLALGVYLGGSKMAGYWYHPVPMRANPTLVQGTATNGWNIYRANGGDQFNDLGSIITNSAALHGKEFTLTEVQSNVSSTGGYAGIISVSSDDAWVQFSAEL